MQNIIAVKYVCLEIVKNNIEIVCTISEVIFTGMYNLLNLENDGTE